MYLQHCSTAAVLVLVGAYLELIMRAAEQSSVVINDGVFRCRMIRGAQDRATDTTTGAPSVHTSVACVHRSFRNLSLLIGQLKLDNTFLLMFCLIHRRIASACPPVLAAHRNTTPAFLDHHSSWLHGSLHAPLPSPNVRVWVLTAGAGYCSLLL